MQTPEQILAATLKRAGYSTTQPRLAVFRALLQHAPVNMNELTQLLIAHTDRASIYRTVQLFERVGIATRLQMGWKYKIELSDAFSPHHHHLTCTQCGKIIAIEENPTIEFELRQLALEADFELSGHQLELQGRCADCAHQAQSAA